MTTALSILTFRVSRVYASADLNWDGALNLEKAKDFTVIGNSIAGAEKVGIRFPGVPCDDVSKRVYGNEVNQYIVLCFNFLANRNLNEMLLYKFKRFC